MTNKIINKEIFSLRDFTMILRVIFLATENRLDQLIIHVCQSYLVRFVSCDSGSFWISGWSSASVGGGVVMRRHPLPSSPPHSPSIRLRLGSGRIKSRIALKRCLAGYFEF